MHFLVDSSSQRILGNLMATNRSTKKCIRKLCWLLEYIVIMAIISFKSAADIINFKQLIQATHYSSHGSVRVKSMRGQQNRASHIMLLERKLK